MKRNLVLVVLRLHIDYDLAECTRSQTVIDGLSTISQEYVSLVRAILGGTPARTSKCT